MEDDINMDLEETGWEREDCIHLAEGQRQVAGSCKQVGVLLIFRRHSNPKHRRYLTSRRFHCKAVTKL